MNVKISLEVRTIHAFYDYSQKNLATQSYHFLLLQKNLPAKFTRHNYCQFKKSRNFYHKIYMFSEILS